MRRIPTLSTSKSGCLVATLGVLVGLTANGCGSSSSSSSTPSTVTQVVVTQTVQAPAETTTVAAPATTPKAAPKKAATKEADGFTMPDEVGKGLQEAQDDIQAASGDPLYFTSSTDASGDDRSQIIDSNWQVCSQNVPAGTRADADTDITFDAVKLDEDCP